MIATRRSLLVADQAAAAPAPGPFGDHATLGDKCIAHWKLNETSGTRYDSHGSNDLTESGTGGVGYNTGKIGNAADFVYTDSDRLYINDNADLSFGDESFAISAWVYMEGGHSGGRGIAVKATASASATDTEYALYGTNAPAFVFAVSNGTTRTAVTWSGTVSHSTWYFVYAEHDATNNLLRINVNNGTETTAAHSVGCQDAGSAFQLGRYSGGLYFDGRIDSMTVWNAPLTAGEQSDLYNSGSGLDY